MDFSFSRISRTRQRLRALSGRVSVIRTRSPTLQEFFSSWARNFEVLLKVFLYNGCRTSRSTATVTVFCMAVLVTTPTCVFRIPLFFSVISSIPLYPQDSYPGIQGIQGIQEIRNEPGESGPVFHSGFPDSLDSLNSQFRIADCGLKAFGSQSASGNPQSILKLHFS